MNTVPWEGGHSGVGTAGHASVGRELFCKMFGGCPGGASNLTIMDKRFDGQIE